VTTEGHIAREKILFVCARNKIRSLTAEKMFAGSQRYDVKSRGVSREARIRLTATDLTWADIVFVMEKNHKNRIVSDFQNEAGRAKMICLFIEDIYQPMEPALIEILRERLEPHLELPNE
jgi:predicted protein tyrosine phosphatase